MRYYGLLSAISTRQNDIMDYTDRCQYVVDCFQPSNMNYTTKLYCGCNVLCILGKHYLFAGVQYKTCNSTML